MTDREMLELAAKAAGVFMLESEWPFSDPFDPEYLRTTFDPKELSITGTRVWYGESGEVGGTKQYKWNPLTDDGDALRLAVKLKLGQAVVDGYQHLDSDGDIYAATRLAIVRAAAEIGRSK